MFSIFKLINESFTYLKGLKSVVKQGWARATNYTIKWWRINFSTSKKHDANFSKSVNNPVKHVYNASIVTELLINSSPPSSGRINFWLKIISEKSPEEEMMMVEITGFCLLYIPRMSFRLSVASRHTAAHIAPERWEGNNI